MGVKSLNVSKTKKIFQKKTIELRIKSCHSYIIVAGGGFFSKFLEDPRPPQEAQDWDHLCPPSVVPYDLFTQESVGDRVRVAARLRIMEESPASTQSRQSQLQASTQRLLIRVNSFSSATQPSRKALTVVGGTGTHNRNRSRTHNETETRTHNQSRTHDRTETQTSWYRNRSQTHNQTETQTQNRNRSQTHNETETQTHNRNRSQTHYETETQTHNRNRSQTHNETETQTHNRNRSQTHSEIETQTHNRNRSQTHNETETQTHNRNRSQTHYETETQTHNRNRSQTHNEKETQTHNRSRSQTHISSLSSAWFCFASGAPSVLLSFFFHLPLVPSLHRPIALFIRMKETHACSWVDDGYSRSRESNQRLPQQIKQLRFPYGNFKINQSDVPKGVRCGRTGLPAMFEGSEKATHKLQFNRWIWSSLLFPFFSMNYRGLSRSPRFCSEFQMKNSAGLSLRKKIKCVDLSRPCPVQARGSQLQASFLCLSDATKYPALLE
ncbi:unnamed protein product [Nesidiocoris tenuis]|uniref:Uncharacterized protein n=1 Tax=Nesidiocoris tenuis TaxID=355587 RepID=A0A6H5G7U3_9HEMI|nr:unnamed protein product [Nesidiocoris tenuis]